MSTAKGKRAPILTYKTLNLKGWKGPKEQKNELKSVSSTSIIVTYLDILSQRPNNSPWRILIPIPIPIPMARVTMLGGPHLVDYFGSSPSEGG